MMYTAKFAAQGSFNRPNDSDRAFTVYVTPFGPKKARASGAYLCFDDTSTFPKWTKYVAAGRCSYVKTDGGEDEKTKAETRRMVTMYYSDRAKALAKALKKISVKYSVKFGMGTM